MKRTELWVSPHSQLWGLKAVVSKIPGLQNPRQVLGMRLLGGSFHFVVECHLPASQPFLPNPKIWGPW